MPIKIPKNLPAASILEKERVFVMDQERAYTQDIRPLHILILNLMPIKPVTETQLLRLLGNTPLQVEVDFIYTESYKPTHTKEEHLTEFYGTFKEIKHKYYDGLIITGAPVEHLDFEDVAYWDEVVEIMDWSKKHAYSVFHICWGAQAGLYHHYGVPKHSVAAKIFGIFPHRRLIPTEKLTRGFDDEFFVPHSRHMEWHREDIEKVKELTILAEGDNKAGVYIVANLKKNEFYISGHAEYDPNTLKDEYERDQKAGMTNVFLPENYFPNDDPAKSPMVRWRSVANLLFFNWLNYYVYQETPYEIENIVGYKEGI